uniref:Tektin n=1 Tax=Timema shepardi TaxID=629360 RepID=A0A7R9G1V6_TIMSH|nr:unnamed protein product [Timema shepardi]
MDSLEDRLKHLRLRASYRCIFIRYDKVNAYSKVQQEIFDVEKNMELLRKAIMDKSNPMKVAQTRLEARTHRRDIELCRDDAQERLVKEVQDIGNSIEYLHRKLLEAEAQHQQLLKTKANLESDLQVKVNSLFIDREKCLGMRRSFPITATIKY